MEIEYRILYHEKVVSDDIPRLNARWRELIRTHIEQKLTTRPDIYGKPLRGSLKGYGSLRIANYRVVFRVEKKTVKVLVIAHRADVYDVAPRRN